MSTCYLPDVNVWFALSRPEHQHHASAHEWLLSIDTPHSVAFTRATQQGYRRLLTTAAIMRIYSSAPLTNSEAWRLWENWFKDERIHWTDEPSDVTPVWQRFGAIRTASPKRWMDSYLASLALGSGYQLVTLDGAFLNFKGLDVRVIV